MGRERSQQANSFRSCNLHSGNGRFSTSPKSSVGRVGQVVEYCMDRNGSDVTKSVLLLSLVSIATVNAGIVFATDNESDDQHDQEEEQVEEEQPVKETKEEMIERLKKEFKMARSNNDMDKALGLLDELDEIEESGLTWFLRSVLFMRIDFKRSLECIDRCLELDPDNNKARIHRAKVRWRQFSNDMTDLTREQVLQMVHEDLQLVDNWVTKQRTKLEEGNDDGSINETELVKIDAALQLMVVEIGLTTDDFETIVKAVHERGVVYAFPGSAKRFQDMVTNAAVEMVIEDHELERAEKLVALVTGEPGANAFITGILCQFDADQAIPRLIDLIDQTNEEGKWIDAADMQATLGQLLILVDNVDEAMRMMHRVGKRELALIEREMNDQETTQAVFGIIVKKTLQPAAQMLVKRYAQSQRASIQFASMDAHMYHDRDNRERERERGTERENEII
eukprot:TRINITY_DN1699_c1_g1_i1.p1 TRINITY_DN1699_c1_g1~~TRINITY_DN1699_c1_g1_i1.p1  ORF type:complete len:452 (-),score=153.93 TRINITY_DN1699_c1_g1_i1:103-1458(-)